MFNRTKKNFSDIIKNGYQNYLGHFDFKKMLQEEKVNFDFQTFGDYLNPKIEIKSEKGIRTVLEIICQRCHVDRSR